MSDKLIGNDLSCSIFVSVTISTQCTVCTVCTVSLSRHNVQSVQCHYLDTMYSVYSLYSVSISTPLSQLVREAFKIEKNKKSVSHGNTDFFLHFRTNLDIHIRPF